MVAHSKQAESPGALRNDQNRLIFEEGFSFSGYERDALYLNLGNKKFLEISGVSGLDSISDGRGAVFADFDNDGDLDVFLTTIQGQTHLLFRNNVGQENNYLRISLEGAGAGRDAYGAVVRVGTSAGTLTKIKSGGSGYLAQHDPRLLFGLGREEQAEWVEVTWPGGEVERFEAGFQAGSSWLLRRGEGRAQRLSLAQAQLPDPLSRAERFAYGLKIEVGEFLPDIPVKDLNGNKTLLQAELRRGRRTLINVWATWCAPCVREMPELESLRPSFAEQGIDLVGLNVDTDRQADIAAFLARTGVQYRNYTGGPAAIEQFYATDELQVPMSVLLDENGVVIEIIPGWSRETRDRFIKLAGLKSTE